MFCLKRGEVSSGRLHLLERTPTKRSCRASNYFPFQNRNFENRPPGLVVVLQAQVRDQIFTTKIAQSVLKFHQLNEDVMFRIKTRGRLRRFEIEGKPLLDSLHTSALG